MSEQARKLGLLKGTTAQKKELFDEFLAVVIAGGVLSETDKAMLEYLKAVFLPPEAQ